MIPWENLGSAAIPNTNSELRLSKRGEEYSIRVNNAELMNSRAHGSEEALAELSCAKVATRENPQVLIGGLGMGFTTAAALRHLPADAAVTVAELVPGLVEWNRQIFGHLAGNPLQDRRVNVAVGDVAKLLKEAERAFDAILLDVDNGPEGLTHPDNDWLYAPGGLRAARRALKPQGVLAVWSVAPDSLFTKRLQQAGFQVTETRPRAVGKNKGARHCVWLASI
ncbi:MAG TPA: MnmC family methyltransferase [Malonomonas sp.]